MKRFLYTAIALSILLWVVSGCGDDISPPDTPTGLSVKATSPSEIEVLWDASTDDIRVRGYRVYRNNQFHLKTIMTGFVDTGLKNATSYCYAVSAFDEDNESALSETECATTLATGAEIDTEAPTAPAGLTATAASDTRIDLTWQAATDNVEVAGYSIYNAQDSSKIDDTTNLFYILSGLTPDTEYCFTVTAFDLAGNESSGSTFECAITNSAAP